MLKYMIGCILFLTACGAAVPQSTSGDNFAPDIRNRPTLTPPPWVESAESVSLDNVTRISLLGRLDASTSTPSTVFAYAFSPDSSRLVGLNNEQLIVWDLVTGKVVSSTARQDALSAYYAPDKSELYTLDSAGLVNIYDAETGTAQNNFEGHPRYNGTVAYDPNNGWLALGGLNGEVKVWDVAARQSLVTITAHSRQITALAFSADSEQLATAGEDGAVQVWDWRNRQSQQSFAGEVGRRLRFSPDDAQLAVGSNSKIILWSLAEGQMAYTLDSGPGGISDVMTYSPDSRYLINGGNIPALMVWDVKTGTLVTRLPDVGGDSTSAAFSPDGNLLATTVLGGAVTLWDITQITAATLVRADLPVGTRQILYADWTSDGYLLTLFDALGPIQVWGIGPQPAANQ